MHDDDDSELFEGKVEISSLERGSSFGLDESTYYRMAQMSMTAAGMRIEPAMICCLPGSERGCKLVLFGKTHAFSVRVRVSRSGAMIDVSAEPLDGPLHCIVSLYSGSDCDAHWSVRFARCARSNRSATTTVFGRLSRARVMALKPSRALRNLRHAHREKSGDETIITKLAAAP
jgi:hypothetical protein